MSYLFGDSTPSPFRINFVEFLRLAIGFSVHALRVEKRVVAERMRRTSLEAATDGDRRRLQQVLSSLADAVRRESSGSEGAVLRCAEEIQDKAVQTVEAGLQAVNAKLAQDLLEIEENIKRERKSSVEAFEKMLLQYDAPESKTTIHVRLTDGRYSAFLEGVTSYGLETVLELTVGPESGFVHDTRVDRFVDGLEVHAPEVAGWLRKESKMTPHKLGRFYIVELDVSDDQTAMKLRASTESNAGGYDIVVRDDEPRVRVTRVGKEADGSPPFETEESDIPNLVRLRDKLAEAARALGSRRRSLLSAEIAEQPMQESEGMVGLVQQFVQVLAPLVREVSAHSLSPSELVLRRMIGDDRREEIFVSKAELRAKLSDLDEEDRRLFDPLELGDAEPDSAVRPSRRPKPVIDLLSI